MERPTKPMALARLRTALESIPELTQLRHDSQAFAKWRRKTAIAVTSTFGNKTRHVHEFGSIRYSQSELVALTARTPDPYQEAYLRGLTSAETLLESMIEEIEDYWEDGPRAPTPSVSRKEERTNTNEVFIIHGRDNGTKETVATLTEGDVEIPSDYAGVVYIPLNEGGWKFELAKELKNAGYPVDFNNLAS